MCPIKPWHCRSQPAFKALMPTEFFQFFVRIRSEVYASTRHLHMLFCGNIRITLPVWTALLFFNVKKDYCLCLNETTEVIMDVRHHHSEHPPPSQPCCHSYKLSLIPSDERLWEVRAEWSYKLKCACWWWWSDVTTLYWFIAKVKHICSKYVVESSAMWNHHQRHVHTFSDKSPHFRWQTLSH